MHKGDDEGQGAAGQGPKHQRAVAQGAFMTDVWREGGGQRRRGWMVGAGEGLTCPSKRPCLGWGARDSRGKARLGQLE